MINAVDIMFVLYMIRCFGNAGRYYLINLNVYKQTSICTSLFIDCLYAALAVTTILLLLLLLLLLLPVPVAALSKA
jgi:hypothetical protein